ncbi:protein FAM151B isoform X2 [Photinus pyralis]|uniref:protein FAM151B isoform X2 n=1 Tax=Photinus pyralis TaxID=7054 RepID=UPI0012675E7C|nr:protein FAM151B isoform X2 [Photinus pyralis]
MTLSLSVPDHTAAFFPNVKGNLTAITWAHAVNSQALLQTALNGSVMMLEADVIIGTLNNEPDPIPIMGHPPANNSDLSLEMFLQAVQNNNMNSSAPKGIKLDFKSIEAVEKSSPIIGKMYPAITFPLWLNADILPGPLNTVDPPVDAARFLKVAETFANATLSIGWKTLYGGPANITNASYTDQQIEEMINVIRFHNVTQPITFPVRAGIAAQSLEQLDKIVKSVNDSTLTLWNGNGDYVDIPTLRELIFRLGVNKVYVDLPDDLKMSLHLDQNGSVSNLASITVLAFILSLLVTLM